jgi:hypothetical protein
MDELSWKIMLSLKQLNMKCFIVMSQEPIKYLSTLFTAAGNESSIGKIHICTLNIRLCTYIHVYICMYVYKYNGINLFRSSPFVCRIMYEYKCIHTCLNVYTYIHTHVYIILFHISYISYS